VLNKILLVLLLLCNTTYAQKVSVSFRTANLKDKPTDFEVAVTAIETGNYRISLELERENGRPFRQWNLRASRAGYYASYFEKTAKDINNLELGYLYKHSLLSGGVASVYDHLGKANYVGQAVIEYSFLTARYVKGRSKSIWEGTFNWDIPVRKGVLKVRETFVDLAVTLLGKYYKDNKKQYWQAKVSVALMLRKGG